MARKYTNSLFILVLLVQSESGAFRVTQSQNTSFSAVTSFQYTSFQNMIICHPAQKPLTPSSVTQIQEIVRKALQSGYTVKALGNSHSGTDIICTKGIPVSMLKIKHFRYEHKTGLATVGAGATMESFLENLHKHGRTLFGNPTYSDITVGGALGTGSHGSSLRSLASPADQMVGVVVVDGLGNLRNITDSETLRAFRAHLGLLGIVYEITFKTTPQFKLHIRHYPQPDKILWGGGDEIMSLATSNDRFQFFWFPTSKQVVLSVGNRVPVSTHGNCQTYYISEAPRPPTSQLLSEAFEIMQQGLNHLGYFVIQSATKMSLHRKVPEKSPIFTSDGKTMCTPAVGYNHRMSSNRFEKCVWNNGNKSVYEFEFAAILPLREFQGAVATMKKILDEYPMEVPVTGIYFRFISPSDGLMNVNSDRASVVIEWLLVTRKDKFNKPMFGLSTSQAIVQALITKHAGRAHWGKNGPLYTQQEILAARYSHLSTFIRHMEKFDPRGVFLNEFGRRIRFGSTGTSQDSYTNHCALVDRCICQSDNDCGDGSRDSYSCGKIQGYRVCKERASQYKMLRARIMHTFVGIGMLSRKLILSTDG